MAKGARGFTLLELIVAATILSILTLMALPYALLPRLLHFLSLNFRHTWRNTSPA